MDAWIEEQKNLLTELGNRLNREVHFAKQIVDKSTNPKIKKNWMNSIVHGGNYCLFQIKILINSLDEFQNLPREQLGFYIGSISIQPLLQIINSYEQSMNKLVDSNKKLSSLIQERIDKKISIIETEWNPESKGKSKQLKRSLISSLQQKIREMAFIRDTLKSNGIINQIDWDILKFAWDIRNSMHNNFLAITNIEYNYPDIKTGKRYFFSYKEGDELDHPDDDLLAYHVIFEQIMHIHFKTLQTFRN